MIRLRSFWQAALAVTLMFGALAPVQAVKSAPVQQEDPRRQAEALLSELTPEERIGQLFLITFTGNQVGEDTSIYDLISKKHIGGVALLASNDNFIPGENIILNTHRLVGDLQQIEWETSQQGAVEAQNQQASKANYIPLLVSISQEGDGYPNDQILSGMTPIPSLMAIGATWNPNLATQVGNLLGEELSALGFNMLFGPSLDVLDQWLGEAGSDLSTRSFGGDPYWVQEMGKAYIAGIRQGSQGQVAVVAKHFPGLGSSDRLPTYEVATVRKTIDQLKQIELVPFFAVTDGSGDPNTVADGLLVSHIRYLFQGNIRATTRPLSLDPGAFLEMMNIPQIRDWHQSGGIMVSDDLSSQAVRMFYDPTGLNFTRQPILDAFLAGNDLLYLNNYIATGDPDSYTTIVKTLDSFIRKYREDPAFALRVDDAVLRILTLKYRMYPEFDLQQVTPDQERLDRVGNSPQSQGITFEVARQAVTLISPILTDLPKPPEVRDRILFITDTSTSRQCSTCTARDELAVDALQSAVLRLYGPQAGGQVMQTRMNSYSFGDLLNVLNAVPSANGDVLPLENDLKTATWIIFSMRNVRPDRPSSLALRRFLSERPALIRNKRLVVFALNAPYYLDATDISKLTAYYGLYGKTAPFLEVAARVLFQEITPIGASPVSIPGIAYRLIEVTAPNPAQTIPLRLDSTVLGGPPDAGTTTPAAIPTFKVGDSIPLQAGPLYDHNNHPVPDGTPVRFIFTVDGGAGGSSIIETTTTSAIARTAYRIDRAGYLEIRAESDPAHLSDLLRLDVTSSETGAVVVIITSTPEPTETPRPTATATATPTPEPTPLPPPPSFPAMMDWFFAMLVILTSGAVIYFGGNWSVSMRWGLRWALSAMLGGLLAYSYLAVGFPGGATWIRTAGTGGILLITVFGVLLGLVGGLIWRAWQDQDFMPKV